MPIEEHNDKIVATVGDNSSVTILKYGATVISWKKDGEEQLWLSEGAKLDGSKPVRGGIPLVFPNFGKTQQESHPTFSLPQHGFGRNSTWEFLGQTQESPLTFQFGLGPENANPEIFNLWNDGKYNFTLIYTVSITEDYLKTKIEVENNGNEAFDFKWLFHTYLRVKDIEDIVVNNLTDEQCFDQLLKSWYVEKSPMVNFIEEFDRIYKSIPENKLLQTIALGKVKHNIERKNLPDTVVWNPWIDKSESMADFQPKSGYLNMLCIENGHVTEFINLTPGSSWSGEQTFTTGGDIKVQSDIF